MFTDLRQVADGMDEPVGGVPRMWTRETNPINSGDLVHRFEQRREIACRIVRRLVVIHDLAEELHLAAAAGRRLAHVGKNLGLGAHPLVTARIRDHAERAEVVAAFDDGDVGAHRIAAPHHPQRKRRFLVRVFDREWLLDRSRPTPARLRLREHRQHLHLLRADHDIDDAGGTLDQLLAFLLRHAAGDRDDRIAAELAAHLLDLAQPRVELLLRPLADAAGVDHHEVGVRSDRPRS